MFDEQDIKQRLERVLATYPKDEKSFIARQILQTLRELVTCIDDPSKPEPVYHYADQFETCEAHERLLLTILADAHLRIASGRALEADMTNQNSDATSRLRQALEHDTGDVTGLTKLARHFEQRAKARCANLSS